MEAFLSGPVQDGLVYAIVAAVAGYWGFRAARATVLEPLSLFLLRRGKVKWAMRLRRLTAGSAGSTTKSG